MGGRLPLILTTRAKQGRAAGTPPDNPDSSCARCRSQSPGKDRRPADAPGPRPPGGAAGRKRGTPGVRRATADRGRSALSGALVAVAAGLRTKCDARVCGTAPHLLTTAATPPPCSAVLPTRRANTGAPGQRGVDVAGKLARQTGSCPGGVSAESQGQRGAGGHLHPALVSAKICGKAQSRDDQAAHGRGQDPGSLSRQQRPQG